MLPSKLPHAPRQSWSKSGQAADRSRSSCSKRGVAWTRARYFRATPRTLRCTLSPQPFLTAAYRRRICYLLLCVLSKRVHPLHPPTLHPLSCCHPSWDDEQAGQLAFTCPYSAHTLLTLCSHRLCASLMPARRAILRALALLAFARSVKVQRCPWPGSLPGSSARRTLLAPAVKLPAARRAHGDGS